MLDITCTKNKKMHVSLKKIHDPEPEHYYVEEMDNFDKQYKVTEKSKNYEDEHEEEIDQIIKDYVENHLK